MEKKNGGFSLIEVIVSVAILSIMIGLLTPCLTNLYRSAREDGYKLEAVEVFRAVKMYMEDHGGVSDDETWERNFEAVTWYPLSHRKSALRPYLSGNATEGAWIQSLEVNMITGRVTAMEYLVDGYVVAILKDGTVFIKDYPKSGNSNSGGGFDPPRGPA